MGNGSIKIYKFIHIPLEIQNIGIQLRLLICNSAAYTDILLGPQCNASIRNVARLSMRKTIH